MTTTAVILPYHWACYLLCNDDTGLDARDIILIRAGLRDATRPAITEDGCMDVDHDSVHWGRWCGGQCELATYTFIIDE